MSRSHFLAPNLIPIFPDTGFPIPISDITFCVGKQHLISCTLRNRHASKLCSIAFTLSLVNKSFFYLISLLTHPVSSLAVCVWSPGCVRITQFIQSIHSNAPHLTFSNENGVVTEKVISYYTPYLYKIWIGHEIELDRPILIDLKNPVSGHP